MATSPNESLAHPPGSEHPPPTHARDERLADVHERLSLALDRANAFGAFVDPRFLVELSEVVGVVLELIEDRQGCPRGYRETGFHCPIDDPLEKKLAQLQEASWVLSWDVQQARLAHERVCLCGSNMSYLALRPPGGQLVTAWALCGCCRHWLSL
jgi:hypothetical protein